MEVLWNHCCGEISERGLKSFRFAFTYLYYYCSCSVCMCAWCVCVHACMMWMPQVECCQRKISWWLFSVSSFPSLRIKLRSSSLYSNLLYPLSHLGGPEKKHMNRELPGMRRLALWRQGESTTERRKSDCESLGQKWGWHILRMEWLSGKLCNGGGGQWQAMFEALKEVRSFKVLTP